MATTVPTKDEILKKLIIRASDNLVLEVYARIEADRRTWHPPWGARSGAAKSWAELVAAAVAERTLAPEEGAILLEEAGL